VCAKSRQEDNRIVIVLCGEGINYSHLPVGTNRSNAMVPVNGKPVIGWILDDLLHKNIQHVTVVVRAEDNHLQSFLKRAYGSRMDLHIAVLKEEDTILQSLNAGLCLTPADGLVSIVLGDTLVRDPFDGLTDFVYVGEVEDSARWCLAIAARNGKIVSYIDKQQDVVDKPYMALSGYYHLRHGDSLRTCLRRSISNGERELSDVLRRYGAVHPIYARRASEWFDFGHIDGLAAARRELLQSRDFNSLSVDPVLNTVSKVSRNNEKLRNELRWYLEIPDNLKVLTPRIVDYEEIDGKVRITQEYYGYPSLAELYVYSDLSSDTWLAVLRHVFRIHEEFRCYEGDLKPDCARVIYVDKTWQRLTELQKQDEFWQSLLLKERVLVNGEDLQGIFALRHLVNDRAKALADSAPISIIHGDLCFSNILFDINHQIIRLIDPRGSFGCRGIYGDPRYDIAKLRHSVCGLYDYIVADMFKLEKLTTQFRYDIFSSNAARSVAAGFDRLLTEAGYKLDDIRFIEGLLFVSMLSLHRGHKQRQLVMYFLGLSLLNEVLKCA